MKKITKSEFAAIVGDAYDCDYENDYDSDEPAFTEASFQPEDPRYHRFVEYFHDEDLLLEEWIYCQRRRVPFIIHEEDDSGNELIFQIRTGEELYDYFVHMKEEFERGIRRFRY